MGSHVRVVLPTSDFGDLGRCRALFPVQHFEHDRFLGVGRLPADGPLYRQAVTQAQQTNR